VTARSSRPDPPTPRPLSNWTIAAGALVVLAVAAVVWFVLLRRYGGQGAQVQLDVIRTAGTLVVGTGGAVALLLTARRQRYTELALVHTDRDATERRITELYTKAADQLGSEKAPVRLAGLHALERLAQNTPEQRQTIVDVICAYLRMPYTPPDEQLPAEDAPAEAHTRYENRRQEQQVRLTAQTSCPAICASSTSAADAGGVAHRRPRSRPGPASAWISPGRFSLNSPWRSVSSITPISHASSSTAWPTSGTPSSPAGPTSGTPSSPAGPTSGTPSSPAAGPTSRAPSSPAGQLRECQVHRQGLLREHPVHRRGPLHGRQVHRRGPLRGRQVHRHQGLLRERPVHRQGQLRECPVHRRR
jgi:hypothetical protein